MNVNVYLPDDIGERAKEAGLPLSRLFRDAVIEELQRRAAMAITLNEAQEHLVDIEDEEGNVITGRIVGTQVGEGGDHFVYLTDDGRVIVYDQANLRYHVLEDPAEELRNWNLEDYAGTVLAIGETPVVDI